MKLALLAVVGSAGVLLSAAALADTAQPPMGQFESAFYTCDHGEAFQVSYDSKKAKSATVTTSNNDHQYQLKRVAGAGAAQFSNGTVNVSISGNDAKVAGTQVPFTGCKLKNTT